MRPIGASIVNSGCVHGWAPIHVRFAAGDCQPGPLRSACTRSKGGRTLHLLVQTEYQALQAARDRQTTPEFKALYANRAGIEGTLSRAIRRCDLRHTRYVVLVKTHLQLILTAVALYALRPVDRLRQPHPGPRRPPAFAALGPRRPNSPTESSGLPVTPGAVP
jgi:transposase